MQGEKREKRIENVKSEKRGRFEEEMQTASGPRGLGLLVMCYINMSILCHGNLSVFLCGAGCCRLATSVTFSQQASPPLLSSLFVPAVWSGRSEAVMEGKQRCCLKGSHLNN